MLRVAGRRLFYVSQRSSTATSFVLSRDHTVSDGGDSSSATRSNPSADISCFNSYHRSLIRGKPIYKPFLSLSLSLDWFQFWFLVLIEWFFEKIVFFLLAIPGNDLDSLYQIYEMIRWNKICFFFVLHSMKLGRLFRARCVPFRFILLLAAE